MAKTSWPRVRAVSVTVCRAAERWAASSERKPPVTLAVDHARSSDPLAGVVGGRGGEVTQEGQQPPPMNHEAVLPVLAEAPGQLLDQQGVDVLADRSDFVGERHPVQSRRGMLVSGVDRPVPQGKKATADDVATLAELKATIQQKDDDLKHLQTDWKQKDRDLKKKEAELKTAKKDRELIEKELATYQATKKAISDLETSVKSLPAEIKSLEDQIAQSTKDELDAKTAKTPQGVAVQQKLRAKLQQAVAQKKSAAQKTQTQLDAKKKQRDEDPLRKYAAGGFLNLPKDVVQAMTGAGLKWGGEWEGSKDFMHFEL